MDPTLSIIKGLNFTYISLFGSNSAGTGGLFGDSQNNAKIQMKYILLLVAQDILLVLPI